MGMKQDDTICYYGDDVPHFILHRGEFQIDDSVYRVLCG
jgi:hypothetical protein